MVSKKRLEAISGVVSLGYFPAADRVSRMGVLYSRYYKKPGGASVVLKARRDNKDEMVLTNGGETKVILDIEGKQYVGVAICSNKDNFCRKTGRKIAILRAFRDYRDSE